MKGGGCGNGKMGNGNRVAEILRVTPQKDGKARIDASRDAINKGAQAMIERSVDNDRGFAAATKWNAVVPEEREEAEGRNREAEQTC